MGQERLTVTDIFGSSGSNMEQFSGLWRNEADRFGARSIVDRPGFCLYIDPGGENQRG